jgi:GxxExxY protein
MDQPEFLHFDLTGKIIGAVHRVYGKLGAGFPGEFYANALSHELTQNHSRVSRRHPIALSYEDTIVGEWCADLLVDERVIIVITAQKSLEASSESTLLNVLRASEFEVGVVVNFGEKLEFRRKVHSKGTRVRRVESGSGL